ncbi:MAG: 50S ribosomal protein L17 [Acidobacteria bacterium]|nr:50S ribosomal protein L17 [Acidobacteriota bacterium]MXZ70489.1 50S ribosomal protein L17 [Acidobacteriota bacterium]MYD72558.1 50S ribosomal protein L17 [Acidobacteriota bacterium]MYJ05457.1 50S ribosomal protein L17 [Acidobacteriota bacterium]
MRHRVAHRKLGRVTEHRIALLRNQATALLRHERITTTVAKAKELRPFVERLITVAKRGLADGADTPRAVHARRLVRRDVADLAVAGKLFETLAPRFAERPGGYTRVMRVGRRVGDDAELAQIELIGSEYDPEQDEPKADDQKKEAASSEEGGGRLRRVARRFRGPEAGGAGPGAADGGAKTHTKRTRKKI